MMQFYIGTLDDADKLSSLCQKYSDFLTIDIHKGRYMIDGCSVLGVISFSGNTVDIEANAKSNYWEQYIDLFYKDLCELIEEG